MTAALLSPRDLALWHEARPYLDVRDNDEHTLVAYGVAKHLVAMTPGADESVVLPTVILHDTGWKKVPEHLLLDAIGKTPSRPDLVRDHERYGVEIARDILERLRPAGVDIEAVLAIIDGHDTDTTARSINDAVMKDADKVWRTTPHGMRTIRRWFGVSQADYLDMVDAVSNPRLLTAAGRAMGMGFTQSLRAQAQIADYMDGAP